MHKLFHASEKDFLVVAFVSGIAGTLAGIFIDWSALFLGFTGSTSGHYVAELMFPYQSINIVKLFLAEFAHTLAGGILGIFVLLTFMSGISFAILKGVGLGSILWLVHVLVIPNLVASRLYLFRNPGESITDLIVLLVWGSVTAFSILRMLKLKDG